MPTRSQALGLSSHEYAQTERQDFVSPSHMQEHALVAQSQGRSDQAPVPALVGAARGLGVTKAVLLAWWMH